jgi:hypothetical protein
VFFGIRPLPKNSHPEKDDAGGIRPNKAVQEKLKAPLEEVFDQLSRLDA